MKPIIKKEEENTILTSEITGQHIVVAVIDNEPCILSKGVFEEEKHFSFKMISRDFTVGNGYRFGDVNTIQTMVEFALKYKKTNIAVFHQADWKQALQWLIDNA